MVVLSDTPPQTKIPSASSAADAASDHHDVVSSTVWFGPFVSERLEREFMAFLGTRSGVAVLTWPRDREHAERLARTGLPCLFLVPSTEIPPAVGPLQDWLPLRASHVEIHHRLLSLTRAASEQRAVAGRPTLDDQGRLQLGDASVSIPIHDRPLVAPLVAYYCYPVVTTAFVAASADGGSPMAVRLWQLSQRVNALGLEVVAAPGNAAVLRPCAARASTSASPPTRRTIATPPRRLGRRRTLPMHFRSGLLAPDLP